MHFAVIGAGAVGGYYGGRLASHGNEVHFLYRSEYDYVKKNGVEVRSCHGDFKFRPLAYKSVFEMPRVDVVIVALKSFHTKYLTELLPPIINSETLIFDIQNGLGNEDFIAEHFGGDRIIAGSAFICSERIAPGVISHTAEGTLKIGWYKPEGKDNSILEKVASIFKNCGVNALVNPRGIEIKWAKLIWNVAFNGLSVYYGGITTADILADSEKTKFAERLMSEVIESAESDGVKLDSQLIEKNFSVTRSMNAYRTSMTVDFLKGRELEISAMLAEPFRRGTSAGKNLPNMRELIRGVRARVEERNLKLKGEE